MLLGFLFGAVWGSASVRRLSFPEGNQGMRRRFFEVNWLNPNKSEDTDMLAVQQGVPSNSCAKDCSFVIATTCVFLSSVDLPGERDSICTK